MIAHSDTTTLTLEERVARLEARNEQLGEQVERLTAFLGFLGHQLVSEVERAPELFSAEECGS